MALRIIANRRIELTDDEWKYYQEICKHYTGGKELFNDLFESDESGLIRFLRPPVGKFTWEIVLFLQNIMVHQYVRKMYREHQEVLKELKEELDKIRSKVEPKQKKQSKKND